MNYTLDYFEAKFKAIPEDRWVIGLWALYMSDSGVKCCVLGHCGVRHGYMPVEADALINLFFKELNTHPITVNDNSCWRYKQYTPKQRILAAIRDIKAKQKQKQIEPFPKTKEHEHVCPGY